MCEDYLVTFHKDDLLEILKEDQTAKHYSIQINFIVLLEHQPGIVNQLLKSPEACLKRLDDAAVKSQLLLLKEIDTKCQVKNNIHCRIYHLPDFPKMKRFIFPCNSDADQFLQISGTVMRVTAAKLLEYQRNYICVKCKTSMLVQAEYDKNYIIKEPKKCPSCFNSSFLNFGELDNENCKDYQEIKIQEDVKRLGVGSIPDTIWVTLEDDLVDTCKPGDNITICGILKRRWGEFDKGKKISISLAMKANHVQVDNITTSSASSSPEIKEFFDNHWKNYSANPLEGRDIILKSLCPQLYGLYLVKLAIAVVLAGGCQAVTSSHTGIRTRSEAHLLLVGDPGTGKSQLLRFASKIVTRSVLTTGIGSTAAGLTVTAMMEQGEWQLEAGALVMADGGICCIDEFNSMREQDRTSIHEAMEQQSISVAKASIVCKLNTRCSILAACNPKGNLDISQPLSLNVALPSPLLSRFDLVMLLKDSVNEEWDSKVADYILNEGHSKSKLLNNNLWTIEMLQCYITWIKKITPKLSEDSENILSAYYQLQRRLDGRNKARTTVRLLESLIRLSQGHARLMCHERVEAIDSIYAIVLVDTAMENESSILSLNVNTNSLFPERPDVYYKTILTNVLEKLQLLELLEKEISNMSDSASSKRVESRFFHKHRSDESKKTTYKVVEGTLDDYKEVPVSNNGNRNGDCEVLNSFNENPQITIENRKPSQNGNDDLQKINTKVPNRNAENVVSTKDNINRKTKNNSLQYTSEPAKYTDKCSNVQDSGIHCSLDDELFNPQINNAPKMKNTFKTESDKNKCFQSMFEDTPDTVMKVGESLNKKENRYHKKAIHSVQGSSNNTKDERQNEEQASTRPANKSSDSQSKKNLLHKFKFVRRDKDVTDTDIHNITRTSTKAVTQNADDLVDKVGMLSKRIKLVTSTSYEKKSIMSINSKDTANSTSEPCKEVVNITSTNSIISNSQERIIEKRSEKNKFDLIGGHKPCRVQNKGTSDTSQKASCSDEGKLKCKQLLINKKSDDSVKNDLQLLKFMPGVNDVFNMDLDIDWNDDCTTSMFSQNSKASSGSTLDSGKPIKCSFGQFDDDSDLDLDI
ncbi:unnamed protein product [Acanthoscelides obtectus]|uniref:DNA helicase MCM9 n=3 Tax=Acanthoscelides obtectus TaxID=200917 RepID=A0A9P0KSW1_ACAOB|nr:unnamed protein product [Acanthoscelides obtectus]CAK1681473.1 DNA helicase MCM9 [Acanthoscelides obtectus]